MSLFHSNKYSADAACEVCDGIVTHRDWCITVNRDVYKAFDAVMYGLDKGDEARLAGMGVSWGSCVGKGKSYK